MSGLYTAMHGKNKDSELLLGMLELTEEDFGRFRDIHLSGDGTKIIALARIGGGNRKEYKGVIDKLSKHFFFIKEKDDDFDCTYAYLTFHVPSDHAGKALMMATGKDEPTLKEKTDAGIARISKMSKEELESDPELGPIVIGLKNALEGNIADIDSPHVGIKKIN